MFNINHYFNNKNKMNKLEKLAELQGVAPENMTAEMIQAVNAELQSVGITGVELHASNELATLNQSLEANAQEIAALTTRATTAEQSLATANARVAELEASNTAMQNELENLKGEGRDGHATAEGGDTVIKNGEDANERILAQVEKQFNV